MRKLICLLLTLILLCGCNRDYSSNVLSFTHARIKDDVLFNILEEYKNINNHLEYKLHNVDSLELSVKIYNNNEVIYESDKYRFDNIDSKLFFITVGTNETNPYFAIIKDDKVILNQLINIKDITNQQYYLKSVNFGGINQENRISKPNEPFILAYVELSLDSNVSLNKSYSFYSFNNELEDKILNDDEYIAVLEVNYSSSKYIEEENPLTN